MKKIITSIFLLIIWNAHSSTLDSICRKYLGAISDEKYVQSINFPNGIGDISDKNIAIIKIVTAYIVDKIHNTTTSISSMERRFANTHGDDASLQLINIDMSILKSKHNSSARTYYSLTFNLIVNYETKEVKSEFSLYGLAHEDSSCILL